ncbi:MAG: MFS transporter, partial [Roseimicrobium sp.]
QAFSSIGGFLVAWMNGLAAEHANMFPAIHGGHEAWRYTLISGVIPALPLLLIRPFLPESPEWQRKKESGQLKRPSIAALFSPELRRTTLLTTLGFAASYGIAFGAIQQLPQILGAPKGGHNQVLAAGVAAQAKLKADYAAAGKPAPSERLLKVTAANASDAVVAKVTKFQEAGGLVGRCLLAVVVLVFLSRRLQLTLFIIPSLVFIPLYFHWLSGNLATDSLDMVKWGIFITGLLTVAQFSFWGNYIPLVFPVHLRGTGESFAANIGGRIIGTAAAWITITLSESVPPNPAKIAVVGACVAGAYALVGAVLTWLLPEPKPEGEA